MSWLVGHGTYVQQVHEMMIDFQQTHDDWDAAADALMKLVGPLTTKPVRASMVPDVPFAVVLPDGENTYFVESAG